MSAPGTIIVVAKPYEGERLRRILEEAGYEVRVFGGGSDFDKAIDKSEAPVILSMRLEDASPTDILTRLLKRRRAVIAVTDPDDPLPPKVTSILRPIDEGVLLEALQELSTERVRMATDAHSRRGRAFDWRASTEIIEEGADDVSRAHRAGQSDDTPLPRPQKRKKRPVTSPWPTPLPLPAPAPDDLDLDALDVPTLPGIDDDLTEQHRRVPPQTPDFGEGEPTIVDAHPAHEVFEPVPQHGTLRQTDPATLFGMLFREGFTGSVRVRRGKAEKRIYLDEGRPIAAASTLAADSLAHRLLREKKLSQQELSEAKDKAEQAARPLSETLLDSGSLASGDLFDAIQRNHKAVLHSVFSWNDGSFELDTEQPPTAERVTIDAHPAVLILEGVRNKYGPDRLVNRLGVASMVLRRVEDELPNDLNLFPEERAAFQAFDGITPTEEIAACSPLGKLQTFALGWVLLALGLVEPVMTAEHQKYPVEHEITEADRERVLKMHALAREADYFALLGVARDAGKSEVMSAYETARASIEDQALGPAGAAMASAIDEIQETLAEARSVLGHDQRRRAYRRAIEDDAS